MAFARRAERLTPHPAVCFNDQDLCVINPNYLNSVRQDNPAKMAGRDLVRVHFGSDGRIDASCFDAGCEVVKR